MNFTTERMRDTCCPKCGCLAYDGSYQPVFSPTYQPDLDMLEWCCRDCGFEVETTPLDRPDEPTTVTTTVAWPDNGYITSPTVS